MLLLLGLLLTPTHVTLSHDTAIVSSPDVAPFDGRGARVRTLGLASPDYGFSTTKLLLELLDSVLSHRVNAVIHLSV